MFESSCPIRQVSSLRYQTNTFKYSMADELEGPADNMDYQSAFEEIIRVSFG